MDDDAHLLISSLPDDFLHWLNAVFRFRSGLDDPCIDHGHLFKQICTELVIRCVKLYRPLHYRVGRYHRMVSRIIFISTNDWRIHGSETVSESLLCTQYIPPGVSPCFGRVDDLTNEHQPSHPSNDTVVIYLGEHFVSFIEVIEQDSDLSFIGTPRQEFAKSPLHALHVGSFERDKTDLI